jgi:hypothetical protein
MLIRPQDLWLVGLSIIGILACLFAYKRNNARLYLISSSILTLTTVITGYNYGAQRAIAHLLLFIFLITQAIRFIKE